MAYSKAMILNRSKNQFTGGFFDIFQNEVTRYSKLVASLNSTVVEEFPPPQASDVSSMSLVAFSDRNSEKISDS